MTSADAFDFYPCLVDGEPASIYVNLRFEGAHAPDADTRYTVAWKLRDPGGHGIGTADEADEVNAREEAVIARATELGLVYVGRLRHRGIWEAVFYGAEGHIAALRAVAGDAARIKCDDDREWRYYTELLLPDAERRQWMDDRRLVQILREQGDNLATPRHVDHYAAFASEQHRDAFVATATRDGFALVEASHDASAELPYVAHMGRTDAIELDHIHDVVMILVDATTQHGGRYSGWKTSIES